MASDDLRRPVIDELLYTYIQISYVDILILRCLRMNTQIAVSVRRRRSKQRAGRSEFTTFRERNHRNCLPDGGKTGVKYSVARNVVVLAVDTVASCCILLPVD